MELVEGLAAEGALAGWLWTGRVMGTGLVVIIGVPVAVVAAVIIILAVIVVIAVVIFAASSAAAIRHCEQDGLFVLFRVVFCR